MEHHPHNFLANAFHHMFGRTRTSVNERGHPASESAGMFRSQSSQPIQPDREAMSLPGSPSPHPVDEDGDAEMLPAGFPSTVPRATVAHPFPLTPDLSQSPSLPPSGPLASSSHSPIDWGVSHLSHPSVIDDDARSDTSMPPLYDASDSESGEEHFHRNAYDFMSDSEADAHDVEMTLLFDDDGDVAAYLDDAVPPPLSDEVTTAEGSANHHVTVEEVQDQDLPHTDTVPPPRIPGSPQLGTSSHVEPHSHTLPLPHPHAHLHLHPHPQPPHPQPYQHLHPVPPQPHVGIQLPTFPGMPGLRAQGQGDGQVPLPGLRTLFQPLFVEAVAEAGEGLRTAQGRGIPGQGPGPTTGPDTLPAGASRTGVPIVQVTFNVPVFRLPTDARPRQQQQTEAQRPAEQAAEQERASAAAPTRTDNPNAENNLNPPAPNPIPDGIPNPLRQFIEALDFTPNPNADGPPVGAPPALTGLLGLLFGLGLGSPELHREDPVRAKRLVNGLEEVSAGLVKRMRKIGEGAADGATCAICWDTLLDESAESAECSCRTRRAPPKGGCAAVLACLP
ncbi:hypothetical protein H4582DRAFT_1192975 [Lactarius indigo]|nr:hypothetical protein H4582DRAFT_1192975 [Lactarius indigo]